MLFFSPSLLKMIGYICKFSLNGFSENIYFIGAHFVFCAPVWSFWLLLFSIQWANMLLEWFSVGLNREPIDCDSFANRPLRVLREMTYKYWSFEYFTSKLNHCVRPFGLYCQTILWTSLFSKLIELIDKKIKCVCKLTCALYNLGY